MLKKLERWLWEKIETHDLEIVDIVCIFAGAIAGTVLFWLYIKLLQP